PCPAQPGPVRWSVAASPARSPQRAGHDATAITRQTATAGTAAARYSSPAQPRHARHTRSTQLLTGSVPRLADKTAMHPRLKAEQGIGHILLITQADHFQHLGHTAPTITGAG